MDSTEATKQKRQWVVNGEGGTPLILQRYLLGKYFKPPITKADLREMERPGKLLYGPLDQVDMRRLMAPIAVSSFKSSDIIRLRAIFGFYP